jgi:polysaccharide deacetylase 2 family uncharacterized protein YibQ
MRRAIGVVLVLFSINIAAAQPLPEDSVIARIAIVIDDLGDRWREGSQAVTLPGDITIGIIPYTPYAKKLAQDAAAQQKEIILHLPMEAMTDKYLGKGGLHSHMDRQQFFTTLKQSLDYLPDIRGINNHMGSRLTQDREKMQWLMQGLYEYGGLYFLDSKTVDTSRAMQVAHDTGIPTANRDVFLDHKREVKFMQHQWRYLQRLAKENGSAVCIAHPYPESLQFLHEHLPQLKHNGIQLLRVSELIQWRQDRERRKLAWQTSISSSR